jgi:hypothetical protein
MVSIALGLAVIMPIIGALILAGLKVDTPQFVDNIATTAIGAMAGIWGPSTLSKK